MYLEQIHLNFHRKMQIAYLENKLTLRETKLWPKTHSNGYFLVWFGLVLCHSNHCGLSKAKSIFIHINSSISNNSLSHKYRFLFTQLNIKTVQFQTIQFCISTLFSSICPLNRCATTPTQSEIWSDGIEGLLRIPQIFSITGASTSDCLVTYPGHLLGESPLSAEMQSVYSVTSIDWAWLFFCMSLVVMPFRNIVRRLARKKDVDYIILAKNLEKLCLEHK